MHWFTYVMLLFICVVSRCLTKPCCVDSQGAGPPTEFSMSREIMEQVFQVSSLQVSSGGSLSSLTVK